MSTSSLRVVVRAWMLLWCMAVLCATWLPVFGEEQVTSFDEDGLVEQEGSEPVRDPEPDSASSVAESVVEGVTVLPVVANEKAKPRDIIKKELLLTNNTAQQVSVYITVSNIDPMSGDQMAGSPLEADLSTSLANWVEITRGVIDLAAGESRKVPYLVHVNLTAKPSVYFARISFHKGSNRAKAEATEAVAELILNLEVEDDANERLQLGGFTTEGPIVMSEEVGFSYLLENVGNREVQPRGSIRIFNRRGEEVGSVPLNADGEGVTPESRRELAAVWTANGRFGKYKAFLDLEYGEEQLASVQDTVYFWIFPWKEILVSLGGVLVLAIIGTYIVHLRAVARPAPFAAVAREEHPALTPHSSPVPPAHTHAVGYGRAVTLGARPMASPRREVPSVRPVSAPVAPRRPQATTEGGAVRLSSRR